MAIPSAVYIKFVPSFTFVFEVSPASFARSGKAPKIQTGDIMSALIKRLLKDKSGSYCH